MTIDGPSIRISVNSEVELISYMPTIPDLGVVNAARVSFGKRKLDLDDKDVKLINYLAEHNHMSPFRHVQYTFRIKAPEFVARQFYKHVVGCHYTSQQSFPDHAWNEISGRYVELTEEFYFPSDGWRGQSKNNRQVGDVQLSKETNNDLDAQYVGTVARAYEAYQNMLAAGCAREMARTVLPLSFMTEWYWTASLQACIHLVQLRTHEGAQKEIRDVAELIGNHLKETAPVSYEALTRNH